MSHKDKEMIKTNKAVSVQFLSDVATASADIYVPFPVKEIHVRGIDIDWYANYLLCVFRSSLFNGGPVGTGFCGVACDASSSTKKLRYIYDQPRDINGSYEFTYKPVDAQNVSYPDINIGAVCFMLEIIGYK